MLIYIHIYVPGMFTRRTTTTTFRYFSILTQAKYVYIHIHIDESSARLWQREVFLVDWSSDDERKKYLYSTYLILYRELRCRLTAPQSITGYIFNFLGPIWFGRNRIYVSHGIFASYTFKYPQCTEKINIIQEGCALTRTHTCMRTVDFHKCSDLPNDRWLPCWNCV